ncbi:RAC family serine/threonine-protein kinase like protein [Tritrichomonas foetus]|uniref:RAC family serine/threonine-protein kinase like protein n=1 Tax=Tritrichomonas foetus TaxID=1144522 RepID=A0A1J4K8P3_9EUKA|nr:RAC family serine/threonine-protein kinase like protein [Tritrichomonas foetus]|eukprot:OHT07256.1 RAC family serine/threonine-protein kinase like protein [Tritrichomonas foetus]
MSSHEGYLTVKSGFLKKSRKKYFILKGSTLYQKKSNHSEKTKIVCNLDEDTLVNYTKQTDHDVLTIQKGKKTYDFTSPDTNDLTRWLLDLRTITFCSKSLTMESFKILSVIGRGFYGKVMLVQMLNNEKLYALKSLHKEKLIQSGRVHTVLAEREILGKVNHPFIARLEFAFQTPTKFYFGLEYLSGGDLSSLMQKSIPIEDIRIYIAEVAIALDFLHSKEILYRDLKPENILIAEDGHLKLVDFGLSKTLPNGCTTHTFCGTTDFLSPEVVLLKPYSYEIDWWALGILLFEMAFGYSPFHDDNKDRFYQKVTQGQPTFPDKADKDLVDLINHLLEKDGKKRYQYKQIMEHNFMKSINEENVLNKKYKPKFIPDLKNEKDVKYCDQECLQEPPVDSIATLPLGEDQRFKGFSYTNIPFD